MTLANNTLNQQLNFLYEIDKLKTIFRKTNLIADTNRLENSAEHSWHLAFYVIILAEYSNATIDLLKVIKMVLLHDIVEIDAGDTFCYDQAAHAHKEEKEQLAATRLFGLLPKDQGNALMDLWQEFEAGETAEAKFAVTVDRLQPLLHNYVTGGGSWKRHDIQRLQVEKRMHPVKEGSILLADLVKAILDDAVNNNILKA
jgi:putative hydrolase of HD superfamily